MKKYMMVSLIVGTAVLLVVGGTSLFEEKVSAATCYSGTSGGTQFLGGPCLPSACLPSVCKSMCGNPSAYSTSCTGSGNTCTIVCAY